MATLLKSKADRVVVTPGGDRRQMPATEPAILELTEHGLYEIRSAAMPSAPPTRIAVNLDPVESDLTPLDPAELVAAVTGKATQTTTSAAGEPPSELTADEAEKQQGFWWYLLVAGVLLLAAETVVANQLSRGERFT